MPPAMSEDQKLSDFANLMKKKLDKEEFADFFTANETGVWSEVRYSIPTGIPQLELALGKDGYPSGRVIELYGWEMSGKTTLAFHAAREVQNKGGVVFWIDSEHSFDINRALELGLRQDRLMVSSTSTLESIFRTIEAALESFGKAGVTAPVLIVVDSITGNMIEYEMKKDLVNDERIGGEAKIIRRGLKRIVPTLAHNDITVMFINHNVSKIGFGKDRQSAGGHGLKFYASVRIECTNISTVKDTNKERKGQNIKITVDKLKGKLVHPSFEIELHNETGFDKYGSLREALLKVGIVQKENQLTYSIYPDNEELSATFTKATFPDIVKTLGGYDTLYATFIKAAIEKELIKPWSNLNG